MGIPYGILAGFPSRVLISLSLLCPRLIGSRGCELSVCSRDCPVAGALDELSESDELVADFAIGIGVEPHELRGHAVVSDREALICVVNERANADIEPLLLERQADAAGAPVGRVEPDEARSAHGRLVKMLPFWYAIVWVIGPSPEGPVGV